VVGQSGVASGGTNAFAYFNGVLSNLGTLGADYSSAFAVNDTGEIVGESALNSTDTHGFVYVGGSMTDVGTLGGTFSTAYLVNSAGQAVGVASTADEMEFHGFVYATGTITDLGTLGGVVSVPNSINSKGQIVGESFINDLGDEHAFLWEKGTLTDLNTLLPSNSGWELQMALYINDAGRIVGVGTSNNVPQWFIMDLAGANNAPTAVAGPDQTVDCQAQVNLNGSASSDPDNDPLTYEWSSNGSVLGTTAMLSVSLPLGMNTVTLKVTDTCGSSSTANLTVTVADTTPPSGSCPAAVTASADSTCQAAVPNLTGQINATDNCTPASSIHISQNPAAGTLVGLGPHQVEITVTDSSGNASHCSVLFTVLDTTAPVFNTVSVSPNVLSPPNNKLVAVTVSAVVSDSCDAAPVTKIVSITCNESTSPGDIKITGNLTALLAATKPSSGSNRIYTITVQSTDASGNSSTAQVTVTVPKTANGH